MKKRIRLSLYVAFGLTTLLLALVFFNDTPQKPLQNNKQKGLLINIQEKNDNNIVSLEGEMEFYWNRLLSPEDFKNDSIRKFMSHLNFPETWNGKTINDQELKGRGHTTYRTYLKFDTISPMSIKIKDYCNSFKIWMNGKLISRAGIPGKDITSTKPLKVNTIADFLPKKGLNELIIQTANYNEKYGGFRQAFLIGTKQAINKLTNKNQAIDAFMLGLLFITFLYYIGLYVFAIGNKAYLYFGLLVFFIFLRQLLLSDLTVLDGLLNNNVSIYLKTTITSAVLSSLMLFLMFREVFPKLLSIKFINVFSTIIALFSIYIFIAPLYYVSWGAHYIQIVILSALAYIFYLVIRSIMSINNENKLIAVGIIFFLLAVAVEAFIFNRKFYSGYILHYGLVIFVLYESYAFGINFWKTNKENILLNQELENKNKNLQKLVEKKIKEATEAKERELFSVMVQKASTEKLLVQLKEKLSKLNCSNKDEKNIITQISNKIQKSVKQGDIDNHLLHFKKIHPYFFETLKIENPSLTNNELKLCAYLKLNLSHKEIAEILHVQPESVRKAKTRMRQKTGLNSDNELIKYLNNIKSY